MTKEDKSYEDIIKELEKIIEKMGEKIAASDSLIASFVKYLNVLID